MISDGFVWKEMGTNFVGHATQFAPASTFGLRHSTSLFANTYVKL